MKKIILNYILFTTLLFLFSCSNDENAIDYPINVEYQIIGRGQIINTLPDNLVDANIVINDHNTWQEFHSLIQSNHFNDNLYYINNNVDFNDQTVLLIFSNYFPEIGNYYDINNISETTTNIIVTYNFYTEYSGYPTSGLTFLAIVIPKTTKEINFIQM